MRRSSTRSRRALSAVALLALAALATGCVTRGRYNRDVGALEDQRDQLTARVADLERSNEALGGERLKLLDEMEDLRVEHDDLSQDVAQLEKTRDLLSTHLREREAQVEELSKLSSNYEALAKDLEKEVAAGQIQITQLREGLRLNLAQDILFRSGSVALEPYGVEVLRKVSGQLTKFPQMVEVQGHSDDVPLSNALAQRWGSNWELAAARASSVVRLFEAEGVDPTRLRAVSYGMWAPVVENDTPENRARNRRIEIRLIPLDEAAAEQVGAAEPAPEAPATPAP
jgi:chemotaxis protein MotB